MSRTFLLFHLLVTTFATVQVPFSLSGHGQSYIAHYREFKEKGFKFIEKNKSKGKFQLTHRSVDFMPINCPPDIRDTRGRNTSDINCVEGA